jgi:hypothetical protein
MDVVLMFLLIMVLKNLMSEATVPSARPVTQVNETEAMVLSAGPAYVFKGD